MADGPHLAIESASGEEQLLPLAGASLTLGRDPTCSLVLDSGYVSRRHATIEPTAEGYAVADAGSRNGTYVNGVRLDVVRVLRSGDEIAIGDYRIRFLDGSLDAGDATVAITSPITPPIRCDPGTQQVWQHNRLIDPGLSPLEFALLDALCERYGRVVSRETLGAAGGDGAALDDGMQSLTQKLQRYAPSAIERVADVGYRIQMPPGGQGHTAPPEEHGTAIILFADIADSTATTERIGDAAFRAKARELDAALRGDVRNCGGRPVEGRLLGDGILAVFTSARMAIEAALRCAATGDRTGLRLHVGLHAGDVIHEDGNVFGGAVNIASRISGLAAPGEVVVSGTVRDLARTSAGVQFVDRGRHELKGVGEPMTAWHVLATA